MPNPRTAGGIALGDTATGSEPASARESGGVGTTNSLLNSYFRGDVRLEDCLQREMAYGLGVDIAALIADEAIGPILTARGSADHGPVLGRPTCRFWELLGQRHASGIARMPAVPGEALG